MPGRTDHGPLIALPARQVAVETDRRRILWGTPVRVFGFPPT